MGGYTDPESLSYDPTLPRQPGICFSATTPGMTPVPQVLSSLLAELAMGCTNPLFNFVCANMVEKIPYDSMELNMTVVNQLMTLLYPKQKTQHRKRVNLPGFLFRVITGEIVLITQRPKLDPVRNSDEIYRCP